MLTIRQVTCIETGFSYRCDIPNSLQHMPTVHPLAFAENVKELFAKFARSGQNPGNELSKTVIAACILSLLKSEGIVECKDAVAANRFLCEAPSDFLVSFAWWIVRKHSFLNCPKISFLDLHLNHAWYIPPSKRDKSQAEMLLTSYRNVCESYEQKATYRHTPEKHAKLVKVFTDKVRAEAKDLQEAASEGKDLIKAIDAEFGGIAGKQIQQIKTAFNALAFLSDSNKQKIASQLRSLFGNFQPAKDLARIFDSTSTAALQDDLLGFSLSIEAEKRKEEKKPIQKVDFMSMLQKPTETKEKKE